MRRIHAGWTQVEVRGGVQQRYDSRVDVSKRRTWKMTLGCSGWGEWRLFLTSDPWRIYINAMDISLTQVSEHTENNSSIRQIRTLARPVMAQETFRLPGYGNYIEHCLLSITRTQVCRKTLMVKHKNVIGQQNNSLRTHPPIERILQ